MKKLLLGLLLTFVLMTNINAATITSAIYTDNKITITGSGSGEIQIVLFNLDNTPAYLTTVTAVDGAFSITLPEIVGLADGTYTVKASDYDGANTTTEEVIVQNESNPPTNDNIIYYIIIGGVALTGMIILGISLSKSKKNN